MAWSVSCDHLHITTTGCVIGDPGNANDLALFWNLRATGANVAFWPPENAEGLHEAAAAHVADLLTVPRTGPNSAVHLWSTNDWPADPAIPSDFEDTLRGHNPVFARLDWNTFQSHPHRPERARTDEANVLGTIDTDRNEMRLSITLPPMPFIGSGPDTPWEQLLASVRVLDDHTRAHTLELPDVSGLNGWYYHLGARKRPYRVERHAVSFFVTPVQGSLTLGLVERAELIRRIFRSAGVTASISSAGRAIETIEEQLGGLEAAEVLRSPGVRELLRTPKWRNWPEALGTIARHRTAGEPDPSDTLTTLLRRGALVAGLKLQCPSCLIRERYTLDQLGEEMQCPRCRRRFAAAPILHASNWEYTASGFFADEGAHGAVPVLLTMLRLQTAWLRCFTFTSHELTLGELQCESDLLAMEQNNKSALAVAIAECKTAGEIDQNDIDNLGTIANALYDRGIECYLIFTTMREEFTAGELARFRTYRDHVSEQESKDVHWSEHLPREGAILLTPRELGQWQITPEDGRGLPHPHPGSLRELAANSGAWYLDR